MNFWKLTLFGQRKPIGRIYGVNPALAMGYALLGVAEAQQVDQGTQLQEITVTARKQTENIQRVPMAVMAVSGDQLQNEHVYDLNDLTQVVPGLNVNGNEPNHAILSIRGITSSSSNPTVGFYVDDIPIDTQNHDLTGQNEPPIFDTQRVEILQGPQGTLYGSSAMGGAVKFISELPNVSAFGINGLVEGAQTQGGGAGGLVSGSVNVPLIDDQLAMRVGVFRNDIPGYIDRVPSGEGVSPYAVGRTTFTSLNAVSESNINGYGVDAVRLSMNWLPGAGVEVIPRFMYQQTSTSNAPVIWPNLSGNSSSFAIDQPIRDRFALGGITVNKSFSFGDFTSITGFVRTVDNTTEDFSAVQGWFVPAFADLPDQPDFEGSTNNSFTEEVRLSNNNQQSHFGYIGGAFFRDLRIDHFQTVYTYGSGATSQTYPEDVVYGDRTHVRILEKSAFGETYFRANIFELTLGGRAYHITQDSGTIADGIFNGGFTDVYSSTDNSGFSPKVVVSAKLSDDHLLYALADRGFRIGGPVELPVGLCASDLAKLGISGTPTSYGSDSLWNYEIGSKNTLANGVLTANATVFYIDWSKLQQAVNLVDCGFQFTGNVGAAVSQGAELQFSYRPLERLLLSANVVYDNAYITKAVPFVPAKVGDPVEQAPRWVQNYAADYSFPIRTGVNGELHADFQSHGSQTQSFTRTLETDVNPISGAPLGATMNVPDPGYLQPAYRLFNTSIGVQTKLWSCRFIVQNIANSHPLLGFMDTAGLANTAYTLTPRTYRLAIEFRQ